MGDQKIFPVEIAVPDIGIVLQELELIGEGEVHWREDGDEGVLRVGEHVRVYKKNGGFWSADSHATISLLAADFIRDKMDQPSRLNMLFPEKEVTMDKYGVETKKSDPQTKEAAEKGVCPICGEKLEEANVPKCPRHGVDPFEDDITLQDVPEE